MAEYYGEYRNRSGKRQQRRNLLLTLLDFVMILISCGVVVVMLLTLIAPYINPSRMWIFSILGLAAPWVYVITCIMTLYWIIRWRIGWMMIFIVLIFIGFFKVPLFYNPEFRRVYSEMRTYDRSTFKFMTYNVRNFYGPNGKSSVDSVLKFVVAQDPDILCMQEFNTNLWSNNMDVEQMLSGYVSAVGLNNADVGDVHNTPLVIYSKFRILRTGASLSNGREEDIHESIWADLLIADDTVRVFNNHLRSTAINAADDDFISNHKYLSDTARDDKIRSMVRRFRDNSILRAAQADTIASVIEATPYRKIVCGDFNDTPMSYIYRKMSNDLQDAFSECGSGYSHTYRGFLNTLRIDYVLVSNDFEVASYEVPTVDYSDHHPVIVRMKYKNVK